MGDSNKQRDLGVDDLDAGREFERYRDEIDVDSEGLKNEAHRLLDNLSAHRVLFSPFSEFDFTPLHRFTHLFDVFIFSDWRLTDSSVCDLLLETRGLAADGLGTSAQVLPGVRVDCAPAVMARFRELRGLPWIFDVARPQALEAFCRAVRLRRHVGEVARFPWLVTIGGNPLNVYSHLFLDRHLAPDMLWLPWHIGVEEQAWGDFIAPGGPLGGLFGPGAAQPRFVAAPSYQEGWRQSVFFQRCAMPLPGFDVVLGALPGAEVPDAVVDVPAGARTVRVSRTPIHPAKIADDELVVLTEGEYRRHQWTAQRVLLSTHAVEAAAQQQARPRLSHLPLAGQPLEKALGLLDEYCRGNGIKHVAASRLGHEDEGPILNEWRKQAGPIERLTLYCEGDGDWLSMGSYGESV